MEFKFFFGIKGVYDGASETGSFFKLSKDYFGNSSNVVARNFDKYQNTTFISKNAVQAILSELEPLMEEWLPRLAKKDKPSVFFLPHNVWTHNDEEFYVHIKDRSALHNLDYLLGFYRLLLDDDNRDRFYHYCLPYDLYKELEMPTIEIKHSASPLSTSVFTEEIVEQLIEHQFITISNNFIYPTQKLLLLQKLVPTAAE